MDDKPPIPAFLARRWPWLLLAIAVLAAGALLLRRVDVQGFLHDLLAWEKSQGPWGPVFFVATCVLACVLLVPGTVLTAAGGFLFKAVLGVLYVSIGTTLGAAAAFLIGRSLLQRPVNRLLARHVRLEAVDDALARRGFLAVLLTRLTPAPSFVMNYAFSATKVRLGPYLAGTWLGMLPRTVIWVYVGSQVRNLVEALQINPFKIPVLVAYFCCTLVFLVVLAFFVRRLARSALAKLTRPPEPPSR